MGDTMSIGVRVVGLDTYMRTFRLFSDGAADDVERAIRSTGAPVLATARSYASGLTGSSGSGRYASSLSVVERKMGVAIRSTDPAAGVKEFANLGAKTSTSKGTRLANRRLELGSGVGVPHAGSSPRAVVRSIDDHAEGTLAAVERAMNAAISKIRGD